MIQYRGGKAFYGNPWNGNVHHGPVEWITIPVATLDEGVAYFHHSQINYELRALDANGAVVDSTEINAHPFYSRRD